jgi:hypothetical protein
VHTWVVVLVVMLVTSVLIATVLLLRNLLASPRTEYERNVESIREIRDDIRDSAPDPNAVIRVDPEYWLGTSDHLR